MRAMRESVEREWRESITGCWCGAERESQDWRRTEPWVVEGAT